ncbi:EF-hand domain and EF-hand domain pair-containing protein [Strongyloides ratti]|uniref:EF-hand domain and EF-hand domain pair-containing protein n=1 Tax=Strongyloides ratti TaxID=34506 RepID=A0A090L997_STRRB|nr:EF-hand domain and EF-hand domain pair-containing protein [Strongyloides ratti]CEF64095.1 EF-hand domain and EF-hand domain pair-containing protein [Strongyloides ratti]
MGNSKSTSKLSTLELKSICDETGFNKAQVNRLYQRFQALDVSQTGTLTKEDFNSIPELSINPLGDRIIDAFFRDKGEREEQITFKDFVTVMAHFRPVLGKKNDGINSRREKLRFSFSMFDLNKNGFITREEFKVILNMMVGNNITTDQLECIADRTITEADTNNDGKISFEEFCKAMDKTDIEQRMSIRFITTVKFNFT